MLLPVPARPSPGRAQLNNANNDDAMMTTQPKRPTALACLGALILSVGHLNASAAPPLEVTATTSMVADLARQVGGDRVTVTGLMGPGVDPHLYKASPSDVVKLQNAAVIFYGGLVLEGKMTDLFARMARTKKHVYPVTESIPENLLLEPAQFEGHYDPHVWFEIPLWSKCVDTVVAGSSPATTPSIISAAPTASPSWRCKACRR
jgi:ABC-type Zn uptake system ZnuABC Zn-binding protein ZnuA